MGVSPPKRPSTNHRGMGMEIIVRLRLMFWALVVPELVLAWSAKQWYTAGRIADVYNRKKGEIDEKTRILILCSSFPQGMKTPGTWHTIRTLVKNGFRGKEDEETQGIHHICIYIPHIRTKMPQLGQELMVTLLQWVASCSSNLR